VYAGLDRGAQFAEPFVAVITSPMIRFAVRAAEGRTGAGVPVAWFSCFAVWGT
jgi:hypothetical protein